MSPPPTRAGSFAFKLVVVVLSAAALAFLLHRRFFLTTTGVGIWNALDLRSLAVWLAMTALQFALEFAGFFLLGAITAVAWLRPSPDSEDGKRLAKGTTTWITVSLFAAAVSLGAVAAARQAVPATVELVLAACGTIAGTWCGWWWLGGWKSRGLLLTQFLIAGLLFVAVGYWSVERILDDQPLVPHSPKVTSAEKRRLYRLVRGSRVNDASDRRLELSQRDVNLLLNMGSELSKDGAKAAFAVNADRNATLAATVRLPLSGRERSYLNVATTLSGKIEQGVLQFQCRRLEVGRVAAPRFVLRAVNYLVHNTLTRDPDLRRLIARTKLLEVEPGAVVLAGNWSGMRKQITGRLLAEMGAQPEVAAATTIYVRHLVDAAAANPAEKDSFLFFLRHAFDLAQRRTLAGSDPTVENRSAIFAMGILFGHYKVERLVGDVTDSELRARTRESIGRVTLRGRRDWTQHFCVSASLALVANLRVSDAVGILKEELDAGQGGSGFSFADLGADMAGTRLASAATRDAQSAKRLQRELATLQSLDPILPRLADLPEGIPDAEFQRKYGGVDGPGYNKIVAEIERRIGNCRLLKSENG